MAAPRIVKRTGEVVAFDRARIRNAMAKAVRAVGTDVDAARLDAIVDRVVDGSGRAVHRLLPERREHPGHRREASRPRGALRDRQGLHPLSRRSAARARDDAGAGRRAGAPRPAHRADARRAHRPLQPEEVRSASWRASPPTSARTCRSTRVVAEAVRTVYDGISTTQIERALVLAAAAFIERDPAYSVARGAPAARSAVHDEVDRRHVAVAARRTMRDDAPIATAFARRACAAASASGLFDARLAALRSRRAGRGAAARARSAAPVSRRPDARRSLPRARRRPDRSRCRRRFWMRVAMGLAIDEPERDARARSSSTT